MALSCQMRWTPLSSMVPLRSRRWRINFFCWVLMRLGGGLESPSWRSPIYSLDNIDGWKILKSTGTRARNHGFVGKLQVVSYCCPCFEFYSQALYASLLDLLDFSRKLKRPEVFWRRADTLLYADTSSSYIDMCLDSMQLELFHCCCCHLMIASHLGRKYLA